MNLESNCRKDSIRPHQEAIAQIAEKTFTAMSLSTKNPRKRQLKKRVQMNPASASAEHIMPARTAECFTPMA